MPVVRAWCPCLNVAAPRSRCLSRSSVSHDEPNRATDSVALRGTNALLSTVRDTVRTQLWPLPTLAVMVAVAAGIGLPELDAGLDGSFAAVDRQLLFAGGADAARTVLSAIAGSLITVTSLTFSLTVVTLQLASGQFSPRLLRTFTSDRFVHATLALFLATFMYALTVLRSVRSDTGGTGAFVPQIAVTVAYVLAVASVLGLVVFLAHLARQIRVETMLRTVHDDASSSIRLLLDGRDTPSLPTTLPPHDAVPVPARASGFLVRVDERGLVDAAVKAAAVVFVERPPGDFLVAGTPVARVWAADPTRPLDDDTRDRLVERVGRAVTAGPERTAAQDIAFGLRQLTDVANKALSPGINDPTTAVHALSHASALLCELAGRTLGNRLLCDDDGSARVALRGPTLADLIDLAISQPRRYGATDPAVLTRIFILLRELAWCVPREQRTVVADQLARLRHTSAGQGFDDHEFREHIALGDEVERILDGRPTCPGSADAPSVR